MTMGHGQQNRAELERPGMNVFMEMLSESFSKPKDLTPIMRFRDHFRKLEKCAQAGDIPGWQALQQELPALAEAVSIDLESDLETKVRLRQIELTLLLKAGHRALREAELSEKEATEAQVSDDPEKGQALLTKAQRLHRLGQQLHNQLLAKTA